MLANIVFGIIRKDGSAFLTRDQVVQDGDASPWLTTNKAEAERLVAGFIDFKVSPIMVSTLVSWGRGLRM